MVKVIVICCLMIISISCDGKKKKETTKLFESGVGNFGIQESRATLVSLVDSAEILEPTKNNGTKTYDADGVLHIPASTDSVNQNACSFPELKLLQSITFNDEEILSEEGNEIQLFIDPETSDSILTVQIYGGTGMATYKFLFNNNLKEAEHTICHYALPIYVNPSAGISSVEKKTLKSSKEVTRELTEKFFRVRSFLELKY